MNPNPSEHRVFFQLQKTNEPPSNGTTSHSGVLLWLIKHLLRRREERRNSLINQSRRNTLTSTDAVPTISEAVTIN